MSYLYNPSFPSATYTIQPYTHLPVRVPIHILWMSLTLRTIVPIVPILAAGRAHTVRRPLHVGLDARLVL